MSCSSLEAHAATLRGRCYVPGPCGCAPAACPFSPPPAQVQVYSNQNMEIKDPLLGLIMMLSHSDLPAMSRSFAAALRPVISFLIHPPACTLQFGSVALLYTPSANIHTLALMQYHTFTLHVILLFILHENGTYDCHECVVSVSSNNRKANVSWMHF